MAVVAAVILMLGTSTINADTIGYWRFEGDAARFVTDSSGNGFTLTKGNGSTPTTYPTQITLPGSGAGSEFDNPIPQNGNTNLKAASFDGGSKEIASQYASSGDDRSWSFGIHDSQLWLLLGKDGTGANLDVIYSGITITAGNDYFAAASVDMSNTTDGVTFYCQDLTAGTALQSVSKGHAHTVLHDAAYDFQIGARESMFRWPGLIDEVRWSDTVLSQGELLASVPEPSTIVLLASGVLGLLLLRRRRK